MNGWRMMNDTRKDAKEMSDFKVKIREHNDVTEIPDEVTSKVYKIRDRIIRERQTPDGFVWQDVVTEFLIYKPFPPYPGFRWVDMKDCKLI